MNLAHTGFWNGIAVAIRMATALVLNKILALYVGPVGYAVVGQFQNAMAMAITFATGAISTGVTKETAEHFDNEARQRALWRTASTVVLAFSAVSSVLIVLFRRPLAVLILRDESLADVMFWFAGSVTFISMNALLLAILNGKKDVRRFVISNIAGSLLGLGVVGVLAWRYGLYGALVSFSLYQGIAFFVTFQQIIGTTWFRVRDLIGSVDRAQLRTLGRFALMATTTALTAPLSLIAVRSLLGETFGWDFAGYWDAMWRISTIYLAMVTSTLSLYWLPRIAEIRAWPELRSELWQAYRLVLPVVAVGAAAIFLMRDAVIWLLFTPDFGPMRQLFAWQLAGDVVKIASWIVAFIMVGKGLTWPFVGTEIAAALMFVGYSMFFVSVKGFEGVAIAHFCTYLSYLLLVSALTLSTERRRAALFRRFEDEE